MPIRKEIIAPGEHYHIFNRGVRKQQIFFDHRDYIRFLFYLLYYQSPRLITNTSYHVKAFLERGTFPLEDGAVQEVLDTRYVKLVAFTLMPNHFHILMEEIERGGISKYMQRSLDGFTRYSHIKYKRSGHIFQGPFKAVHVIGNTQLLHLSSYIHRNPVELLKWRNKYSTYPWSSYQDYIKENRWKQDILMPDVIRGQFKSNKEYQKFVATSTAKQLPKDLRLD